MTPNPHGFINLAHPQVAPSYTPMMREMLVSPTTGRTMIPPPLFPNQPKEFNMPLEQYWHVYFDHLFNGETFSPSMRYIKYLPDGRSEMHRLLWELIPVGDRPASVDGLPWNVHGDTAKVRFHCSNPVCDKKGSGWTSVNGSIQFWWQIVPHLITGVPTGYVAFKLFGQKCSSSSCGDFEPAMWYHEEVAKVLWNAFVMVRRQLDPNVPLNAVEGIRQCRARPKKPHEQDKCEACASGNCSSIRSRESSTPSTNSIEYQAHAATPLDSSLYAAEAHCQQEQ
uniref:3CxxC-type domain-containing protein n=1 Tax=Plectus sambesii TaxID=2011161 RepID=A0A914URV3_9BILA